MKNKFFPTLFVTIGVLLGALFFQQQFSLGAFAPVSVPAGGTGFSSTSIGTLIAGGSTATSTLVATSSPTVGYITATSTTATSTFANGINILGGCLRVGGSCLTSSSNTFGTTSIFASAPLVWNTSTAQLTTNFSTSTTNVYSSLQVFNNTAGVGTSTPATTLGVQGNLLVSGNISSANITATGTVTFSNALTVGNGGTGSTTLGGILLGNGTSAVSATGTVAVAWGGTGAQSFTLNSLLVGNNNGALIASTSLGDNVISDGLTLTNITQITNRAITDLSGTLLVANGGTGSTTLGGILVGAGTSAVSASGTISVAWGGTGANSFTLNSILVGNTNGALIASTSLGNDVISDGLTLTNLTQITNRAISDTSGTLLVGRGGTGATTLGDTELLVGAGTNAVTSTTTLAVYRGGTGFSSYSIGDLLYAGASNTLTKLAISGTAGQVLMVSGGVPIWAATSSASGVSSVSANGTSLTISPTTGAVLAEINLANANTWTALQTFGNASTTRISSTRGAQFATLDSDQFVGIGTSTPSQKLEVRGTSMRVTNLDTIASHLTLLPGLIINARSGSNVTIRNVYALNDIGITGNSASWIWSEGINQTTNEDFSILNDNLTRRDFHISDTTGYVGLGGTSTPSATLAVQGNSLISGTSTTANLVATGTIDIASSTVIQKAWASFSYATSTQFTGTTTQFLGVSIVKETWDKVVCYTDTGNVVLQFKNATLNMNDINASTATSTTNFTANNSLPALTKRSVNIGSAASSPTKVSCTIEKTVNY